MTQRKKVIAKWVLGLVSSFGIFVCLEGWDPNYIGAVVWAAVGSVAYYSAIRWLWRVLL